MVVKLWLTLLSLMLISAQVKGEMRCKMRYDVRAYMTWFDFGAYFIYGLYEVPPKNLTACNRCQDFGNVIAELHYTVVALEDNRTFWLNKENIVSLGFFQSLVRTFEVHYLFVSFFTQALKMA